MIELLLCLALPAAPAGTGTLVLCGEAFELPEALARELAQGAPHLLLDFDGPGPDPLAQSGSAVVRPDLSGDWNLRREAALLPEFARTRAVVLQAATWLSCWQHLEPEQKDSRLAQELRAALRAGRPVVACGAAAGYCASWSLVSRTEIRRTQRNPRADDPNLVATGLDFAHGWMLDTSVQQPATGALRLLRATQHFGNARALFLAGPVAWIVRGERQEAEVAGSGTAAVLDLSHARRSRGDLREGRLLLLQGGDRLRFEKELEQRPSDAARPEPARAGLGLPFEPVRNAGAGFEYRFDWIVQR
jgi:hypothetical protein